MQIRYQFRIYPDPSQQVSLAQAFGCARVVFNDCLRVRQQAYSSGTRLSDTEIQKAVVTLAKATPERSWLADVASVILVQACQDARRAYRNWFDSLSGKRRGPRLGPPRFRSRKDNRQSIRFTRNGFRIRESRRLFVAKVGDLDVRWSRELPSEPSSVTIIRDAAGRFFASFVVEVSSTPLPPVDSEVGIDLGLTTFAVLSNGTMADARRDWAHKRSTEIIRDNQAVFVEDLCIRGLARTRLAKSVHDAGWGMFLRMLEQKAARYGRTFGRVDRFYPSSQLCSTCGASDGPKPLSVREWKCSECGVVHHRDLNAAINIHAAGRAEWLNACGGAVSLSA